MGASASGRLLTEPDGSPRLLPVAELRTLFLFEALAEDQLAWLHEHGRIEQYPAGSTVFTDQQPATWVFVLLAGTMGLRTDVDGTAVETNRTDHRGAYCGAVRAWLETEETQNYVGSVVTHTDCTFLVLPATQFGERLRAWFPMAMHLLAGLYLGLRTNQAMVGERQRLTALGRLTAGLTHELNNPAAAAVRATATLRERVAAMRHKLAHLASGKVDAEVLAVLAGLQEQAIERAAKAPRLTAVQATDAEDALTDWLDEHDVSDGWQIAEVFVAAGLDTDWLEEVAAGVPAVHLEKGLRWIAYSLETEQLMDEIGDATDRISGLIASAKQYSQLDRAEYTVADLHDGLDSTLAMLAGKLTGVQVVKDFDRTLPAVPVYAGELNQVWTNVIDNAIGAMAGSGSLTLRTYLRDGEYACVEIGDTGPGIPPEVQTRIFEPFFTTKPIGEGTGLGLDISWRIVVQRHRGDLSVQSEPGNTRFTICIPLVAAGA